MKKIGIALMFFMSVFAHAQVSINVNIGTPPNWGPEGNDNSRYYYLPDIDIYYDVAQSQFIYENNGKWVRENKLPAKYRQYDLYGGYKVVLNDYYRGEAPYTYHEKHRTNYPKGYQGTPQQNRGNKPNNNNNNNNKSDNNKQNTRENNKQNNQGGNSRNDNSNKSRGNSNNDQNHSRNDRK